MYREGLEQEGVLKSSNDAYSSAATPSSTKAKDPRVVDLNRAAYRTVKLSTVNWEPPK